MHKQGMFLYVMYHLPSAGLIALIVGAVCVGAVLHYRREEHRAGMFIMAFSAALLLVMGAWVYALQVRWNRRMDVGPAKLPLPAPSMALELYTLVTIVVLIGLAFWLYRFAPNPHIRLFGGAVIVSVACLSNELWIGGGDAFLYSQLLCELWMVAVACKTAYQTAPLAKPRTWRQASEVAYEELVPVDTDDDEEEDKSKGGTPAVPDTADDHPADDDQKTVLIDEFDEPLTPPSDPWLQAVDPHKDDGLDKTVVDFEAGQQGAPESKTSVD